MFFGLFWNGNCCFGLKHMRCAKSSIYLLPKFNRGQANFQEGVGTTAWLRNLKDSWCQTPRDKTFPRGGIQTQDHPCSKVGTLPFCIFFFFFRKFRSRSMMDSFVASGRALIAGGRNPEPPRSQDKYIHIYIYNIIDYD